MKDEKYTLEDIKNDLKEAGVNPSDWSKKDLEKMRDKANKKNERREDVIYNER